MRTSPGRVASLLATTVALGLVAVACSSGGGAKAISGAGSTFAQPVYTAWAQEFVGAGGAQVNYQGVGSGAGIQDFANKTVAFGATDVPLQTDDPQPKGSFVQIPTMVGAVAILYNVSGAPNGLKLDGTTAADIFLGKVTKWNDPEIAKLNPGVPLPATAISTVHRSDESGTTAVFTGWLSDESSSWKSKIGSGKAVQWIGGVGANGSSAVAAAVKQTDGSIGYASQDYAVSSGLSSAAVQAPDGSFVSPTTDAMTAAAGGLKFPITPDTNILNSTASGAYPIATTTYALLYTDQTDQKEAQTLVSFFHWGLTAGQTKLKSLNYAPLPANVLAGSLLELKKIKANGSAITPSP
jgi:phosphate transport system substrate-binding protein